MGGCAYRIELKILDTRLVPFTKIFASKQNIIDWRFPPEVRPEKNRSYRNGELRFYYLPNLAPTVPHQ